MLDNKELEELREIFGRDKVLTDPAVLKEKSLDLCPDNLGLKKHGYPTGATVVRPGENCDGQLQKLMALVRRRGLKILTLGGGSGVCGAFKARGGEIVVDMTSLDKIVLIKEPTADSEGLVMVEAGVFGDKLDEFLKQKGFTHGHYPASLTISTIAGNTVTCSNGIFSLFFGNIENLVLAVEGVNGNGQLVKLEGDNLKRVFRTEGSTMIVTRVWLKVFKIPAHDYFLSFRFDHIGETVGFLKKMPDLREKLKSMGVRLCTARAYDSIDFKLMSKPHKGDSHKPKWLRAMSYFWEKQACRASRIIANTIGMLERRGQAPWTVVAYMSSDSMEALSQAAEMVKNEALVNDGVDLGPATAHSWYTHSRKLGYDKVIERFNAGITVDTFECTMPWEKVIEAYEAIRSTIFKFGLVGAHIGIDMNRPYLYFIFGITGKIWWLWRNKIKTRQKYQTAKEAILYTCVENDIATTHHHGIGDEIGGKAGRAKTLAPYAYGREWYYEVLLPAKREMDPHNLLNDHFLIKTADNLHL